MREPALRGVHIHVRRRKRCQAPSRLSSRQAAPVRDFGRQHEEEAQVEHKRCGKVADPTRTVDDGAKTLGFNGMPKRMFCRPEKRNTRQLSACAERWKRRRRNVANLSPQRRRTPPKHPRQMQENLEPPSWRHQRWLRRQDRLSEPSRAA